MLDPSPRSTGQSALVFAAFMLELSVYAAWWRGAWPDAIFWIALAIMFGCYGAIALDALPRLHTFLIGFGLLAAAAAFGLAVQAALRLW